MFRKRDRQIEDLKGQVSLLWDEVLKLREETESDYYTPVRRHKFLLDPSDRPTLRGKVEALAEHLGLDFEIVKRSEKVKAVKKGKK